MENHMSNKNKIFLMCRMIITAPKRWVDNIIVLQEKKKYNFFVILLFSFFVGLVRFILELILGHRTVLMLNISILNFVIFYLHTIFIYTMILRIFVPKLEWRKSINLVLVGVFLGIFPPVIDVFIYGIGSFTYNYSVNFPEGWRLLLYNEKINFTFGETITLFLTMFFTMLVVFKYTKSIIRALLAFFVTYLFVVFLSQVIPTLAFNMAVSGNIFLVNSHQEYIAKIEDFLSISGFSYPCVLSFMQIVFIFCIYLFLNPGIAKNIMRRINHAIPAGLTCLLGYSIHKHVDGYAIIISIIFMFAFIVAIIQNDFFDRTEDDIEGRSAYLDKNDVTFFNSILFIIIALLLLAGNITGYLLLLFMVVSFLYNYDYYRAKKYFPANNKIEGIFGVSAFLGGLSMAFIVDNKISGDVLNIQNLVILFGIGAIKKIDDSTRNFWNLKYIVMTFLVFGGWFFISIFKDYKDIQGDSAAGNQTVYTLLKRRNKDIYFFHKLFSLCIFIFLLIPPIWLIISGLEPFFSINLITCDIILLIFLTRKKTKRAVEMSFAILNIYLLCLVIGSHLMHQL